MIDTTQIRRTRRKDARPGEIVAAAMLLFTERGFAATRLDDVAAAAGISKGTIYLYFSNKDELFRAVVRKKILPRLALLERMVRRHDGTTENLLRSIAIFAEHAVETEITAIPKLVMTESGNFPELARFYGDAVVKRMMRVIDLVIARGVARGELRPIEPLALMPLLIAPVLMLALWKHSLGRHTDIQFSTEQIITNHLDILLRGLAPDMRPS